MSVSFYCPICREECDGPVQLSCGHVFCGSCISVVATACKSQDAQVHHLVGSADLLHEEGEFVKCPLCRAVVPVPLCPIQVSSNKELLESTVMVEAIMRRCPTHVDKQATHYCYTCSHHPLFCDTCVGPQHGGHDVRLIAASSESILKHLQSARKTAEYDKSLIPAAIEATMSSMESISDSIEGVCDSIRQHADRCVAEIRRLEEELIEKAYQKHSQVCKAYELQLTDLETLQSHLELGLRSADSVEGFPPNVLGNGYLYAHSILYSACTLAQSYSAILHNEIRFLPSDELRIYNNRPSDAHFCSLGNLVVEKTSQKRQKLLEQSNDIDVRGECLLKNHFGQEGTKDGHFKRPLCVHVHEKTGNIYVSDFMNHRVQIFDEKHAFVGKFGKMGNGVGCFNQPWGIASTQGGEFLAVADSGNRRVQLFTTTGDYISSIGSLSTLQRPQHITFDKQDRLFVADFQARKIQIFSLGGALLKTIGDVGQVQSFHILPHGVLCYLSAQKDQLVYMDIENSRPPKYVDIDPVSGSYAFAGLTTGEIIMSDSRQNLIRVFSSEGQFINKIGATGNPDIQLASPEGLCLHGGRLFVCDHRNSRILVY